MLVSLDPAPFWPLRFLHVSVSFLALFCTNLTVNRRYQGGESEPTMKKQIYKKGEAIFKIGDPSRAIFLLVSGQVGLFFPTDPNTPYTQIGEMETFGEMGLVENELRNATARCLDDCEILHIEREDFETRVNKSDPLLKALIRSLSARLRDANKKISMTAGSLVA